MSQEAINAILQAKGLPELWELSEIYEGEPEIQKARQTAKKGKNGRWDINYLIHERYTIKGDTVFLEDRCGTQLKFIEEWCDDIDERKVRLRTAMYEHENNDDPTEAR